MLSKNQISFIRSLQQNKFREKQGLFVAEGEKMVNELLSSSMNVQAVYATPKGMNNLINTKVPVHEITMQELQKISSLSTPNEMLCIVQIPACNVDIQEIKNELVIALDRIRDPGNMGTIIRIADWFGISHIICSEDCVDIYNPKVIQATMGSIARVRAYSVSLPDFFKQINANSGFPLYGAVLNEKSVFQTKLKNKGIILMGNESEGISSSLFPYITDKISIPRFGKAESLNVAIATAVICAEFKKQ